MFIGDFSKTLVYWYIVVAWKLRFKYIPRLWSITKTFRWFNELINNLIELKIASIVVHLANVLHANTLSMSRQDLNFFFSLTLFLGFSLLIVTSESEKMIMFSCERFLMWANSKLVLNFSYDKFSLFVHQTESHYAAHKLKLCCSIKIKMNRFTVHWVLPKTSLKFDSTPICFPSITMIRKNCWARFQLRLALFLATSFRRNRYQLRQTFEMKIDML